MRARVLSGLVVVVAVLGGSSGVALGFGEPAISHDRGVTRFDRSASLLTGGRSVRVGGPAECPPVERIFLTVRITQGNRTAVGAWPKHACTGKAQHWSLIARVTTAGRSLRAGSATAHGLAVFKRNGRTVGTNRWSASLTLR